MKPRKEAHEQTEFFIRAHNYLKSKKINQELIFAIPNGGTRHIIEAVNLKRQGVKSGIPDIFFCYPSGNYHGLFIEMKRIKGGKLSESQKICIDIFRIYGYRCEVCMGADEAINCLKSYVEGK